MLIRSDNFYKAQGTQLVQSKNNQPAETTAEKTETYWNKMKN